MPGMYAPPAVELPNTRQIDGMPLLRAPRQIAKAAAAGHEDLRLIRQVGAAPTRSARSSGSRFCSAMSLRAAALPRASISLIAPPLTVESFAVITTLDARDRADAADEAAAGRVTGHVLAGERSTARGSSESRSSSSSMRSRGSSLPAAAQPRDRRRVLVRVAAAGPAARDDGVLEGRDSPGLEHGRAVGGVDLGPRVDPAGDPRHGRPPGSGPAPPLSDADDPPDANVNLTPASTTWFVLNVP